MEKFLSLLSSNLFIRLLMLAVMLDCFMGAGRAIKEGKFNSCIGIDGGIRKVCMVGCVIFLAFVDLWTNFNFLFMIPNQLVEILGVDKLGICEFFSILFILYEIVSILKNMILCGLPVPKKIKSLAEKLLDTMTNELEYKEVK